MTGPFTQYTLVYSGYLKSTQPERALLTALSVVQGDVAPEGTSPSQKRRGRWNGIMTCKRGTMRRGGRNKVVAATSLSQCPALAKSPGEGR